MPESQAPNSIDYCETLESRDPFSQKVKEVVDREFPVVKDAGVERRKYPILAEMYDMSARLLTVEVNQERGVLGEEGKRLRAYSIPEVTAGITLLAGKDYKRDGRAGEFIASHRFPGDLSVEVGNTVHQLYAGVHDRKSKTEIEGDMRTLCAEVVGRNLGPLRMDETFGKLGVNLWFETKQVVDATEEYIAEKEQAGEILEGGLEWFKGFRYFVESVAETPFQRVLGERGRFTKDPMSQETAETVAKIYNTQLEFNQVDPKIEAMAKYLGIVESGEEE